MADVSVSEPFPIFLVANRYLIHDINVITYIRRKYNTTGVLIGSIPQVPQQNVFMGVPLELMPEEARLLVEKRAAHIVDDVKAHKDGLLLGLSEEERKAYTRMLEKQGLDAARAAQKRAVNRKEQSLQKLAQKNRGTENWNDIPDMFSGPRKPKSKRKTPSAPTTPTTDEEEMLFGSPANSFPTPAVSRPPSALSRAPSSHVKTPEEPLLITPTLSYPPLQLPTPPTTLDTATLPPVPRSYPLFAYLHSKDYFLLPGLRFGCQYMAYPGDPLRFHSHFLVNGMDWDEEINLLDLVGGGRLGTGVKKGYLIGGKEGTGEEVGEGAEDGVRAFCIEWGGM
ncbi:tRNA-splicing endonuclease subunit sen34 [Cryomyces antarcticus]